MKFILIEDTVFNGLRKNEAIGLGTRECIFRILINVFTCSTKKYAAIPWPLFDILEMLL
jgi:hypothetical protein